MNVGVPSHYVPVETALAEALLAGTGWQRDSYSNGERIHVPRRGLRWHVAAHTLGGQYYFNPTFLDERTREINADQP